MVFPGWTSTPADEEAAYDNALLETARAAGLPQSDLQRLAERLADNRFGISGNGLSDIASLDEALDLTQQDTQDGLPKAERALQQVEDIRQGIPNPVEAQRALYHLMRNFARQGNIPDAAVYVDDRHLFVSTQDTVETLPDTRFPGTVIYRIHRQAYAADLSGTRQPWDQAFSKEIDSVDIPMRDPASYRLKPGDPLPPMMEGIQARVIQALQTNPKLVQTLAAGIHPALASSQQFDAAVRPLYQTLHKAVGLQHAVPMAVRGSEAFPLGDQYLAQYSPDEDAIEINYHFFQQWGQGRTAKEVIGELVPTVTEELIHARQQEMTRQANQTGIPKNLPQADQRRLQDYMENNLHYNAAVYAQALEGSLDSYEHGPFEHDAKRVAAQAAQTATALL